MQTKIVLYIQIGNLFEKQFKNVIYELIWNNI